MQIKIEETENTRISYSINKALVDAFDERVAKEKKRRPKIRPARVLEAILDAGLKELDAQDRREEKQKKEEEEAARGVVSSLPSMSAGS